MTVDKINLREKFAHFSDYWSPKIVGDINDAQVKLVKIRGEFTWHHHDIEDELFLVVKGRLLMRLRDRNVEVDEGECIIIPRGMEHCPAALSEEVHILLMEPKTTLNTGNVRNDRTLTTLERI